MQALSQQKLNTVLTEFVAECKSVFGDKLHDVRLFGSYARGDYDDDSDIDIMVIFDLSNDEVRKCFDDVCHIASELDLKYIVTVSPVLKSKSEYDLRKHGYGFCRNVEMEGVSKYAG